MTYTQIKTLSNFKFSSICRFNPIYEKDKFIWLHSNLRPSLSQKISGCNIATFDFYVFWIKKNYLNNLNAIYINIWCLVNFIYFFFSNLIPDIIRPIVPNFYTCFFFDTHILSCYFFFLISRKKKEWDFFPIYGTEMRPFLHPKST